MHPDQIDTGELTEIYKYISYKLVNLGFELRSEGTYQTKQIYLDGTTNPVGAIQYEGSNDFEKKLPTIVNLRFNRKNIPNQWKEWIEKEDRQHRQILKIVVTHKFEKFDNQTKNYIDDLCDSLKSSEKI